MTQQSAGLSLFNPPHSPEIGMLGLIKHAWTLAGASQAAPGLPLPIGGLPDGASTFQPGLCYGIGIEGGAVYRGFVGGLLGEMRAAGMACRLLVLDGGADFLPAKREPEAPLRLEMLESGWSEILRSGAGDFLECIEETLFPPGGLLIIVDPQSRFMDMERAKGGILDVLISWAKAWNHAVVFLARLEDSQTACPPLALARFGGVASIMAEGQKLVWRIAHWHRPDGSRIVRAGFSLNDPEGGGRLAALGEMTDKEAAPESSAPDEDRVIAVGGVADFDGNLPPAWEVLDDPYPFEDYLTGALAPTLILAFDQDTDFDRLARLIEQIRHEVGSGIKLVLRETDLRIRRYQEHILLRAGLNQVVRAYEGTEVLRRAVRALQGVCAPALLDGSVLESMLNLSTPPRRRGYLPPLTFCATLLNHLTLTNPYTIDHALLKLKLLPGITPLAALGAYRANRRGDLITADGSRLYLFLFGCGGADIPVSLSDGFPADVAAYLLLARQWTEIPTILESLSGLAKDWAQDEPTDPMPHLAELP